ncbi:hypothetical protein BJ138DRAFT_1159336 [Hygrophoropsis aurantiaca]|uniref:Uncharacterized protein n=1 Tax=Hygrophoropsis aurantiaca TaxID=72124 RepID=A0ACB8A3Y6_9AGAM|nr:hypothetical protein BJ138DRAFT_1159336 [Hygrophoropsis aurantiaca]
MFISRILSLVAFSVFVAAACDQGLKPACCIVDPGNPTHGFACIPSEKCGPPRSPLCCVTVAGPDTFTCRKS